MANTVINGTILRILGDRWRDSLYAGTLLSRTRAFSFILAAAGIQATMISDYGCRMTIEIISVSPLIRPPWIMW